MKSIYALVILVVFLNNFVVGQAIQFGSGVRTSCPLMEVGVEKTREQVYTISYCNHGNLASVGTYVEMTISNHAAIIYSALPYRVKLANVYRVDLGTIQAGACHQFSFVLESDFEDNGCLDIKIYPDNPCQSMIDRYLLVNNSRASLREVLTETKNGNGRGGITTFSPLASQYVGADDFYGDIIINSIFEDNVMLNTSPTLDSLRILAGSGSFLMIGTSQINNNNILNISELVVAAYCTVADTFSSENIEIALDSETDLEDETKEEGETTSTVLATDTNQKISEEETTKVFVYPNPFDDYTTFELQGVVQEARQLQLIDITGRTVRTQQVEGQKVLKLYKENLVAGVYFYRLNGNSSLLASGKIIVK